MTMSRWVFQRRLNWSWRSKLELFQIDLQMLQGGGRQFQAQGGGALLQEGQGVRSLRDRGPSLFSHAILTPVRAGFKPAPTAKPAALPKQGINQPGRSSCPKKLSFQTPATYSFPQAELAEDAVQDGLPHFLAGDLAQFPDGGREFQGHQFPGGSFSSGGRARPGLAEVAQAVPEMLMVPGLGDHLACTLRPPPRAWATIFSFRAAMPSPVRAEILRQGPGGQSRQLSLGQAPGPNRSC